MEHNAGQKIIKRYSRAFQQKVVTEIETGQLRISSAMKLYDITGATTIQGWIRKHGKQHLLNKVVRIEMKDEQNKIQEQEKKIRALQAALSDAHLKIIALESTITVLERETGAVKKNIDTNVLKKSLSE